MSQTNGLVLPKQRAASLLWTMGPVLPHGWHCCQNTTRNQDNSHQSQSLYSVWNTQLHYTNPGTSAGLKVSSERAGFTAFLQRGKNCLVASSCESQQNFKSFGHFWKALPGMLVPTVPYCHSLANTLVQLHSTKMCSIQKSENVKIKRILYLKKKHNLAVGKLDWTVFSVFSISIFHNPDLLYISGLASSFNKVAAEFPACHTGTAELRNLDPSWWQNM